MIASRTKYQRPFDFYVNLDYEYNCPEIRRVLLDLYGLRIQPVPVYHGDRDISWLQRYIDDGHKLIGISTCNRTKGGKAKLYYYDSCFNLAAKHSIALHGFAQTGVEMFQYPWYSVDSSSWLKAAGYGRIVYALDGSRSGSFRLRTLHVSAIHQNVGNTLNAMPDGIKRQMRDRAEAMGFDLDDLRSVDPKVGLPTRGLFNVKSFLAMSQNFSVRPRARFQQLI